MKLKAVFLDKDGSIIPEVSENPGNISASLNEEVVEGLQLLQSNGYLLMIVSNKKLRKNPIAGLCSKIGIYLDGFYRPQKLKKVAEKKDIDLSSSWMIGDVANDMEAGISAGCKTLLISRPADFADAAKKILSS